jgi:hypothetical protein
MYESKLAYFENTTLPAQVAKSAGKVGHIWGNRALLAQARLLSYLIDTIA